MLMMGLGADEQVNEGAVLTAREMLEKVRNGKKSGLKENNRV